MVAIPLGLSLRRISGRLGWMALVMGPLAVVLFAPSLLRDRVSLGENGFQVRTGLWGLTSVHEVDFARVQRVRIVSEEKPGYHGIPHTNCYLLCEQKDGTSDKVPITNTVCKAAAPRIFQALKDRRIPIINEQ